jgi:hypothetical protein
MRVKSTPVYARQRSRTPTLPQLNAVDLLAAGKTDTETAELLSLDRTTVTKWRLYDPVFQAALTRTSPTGPPNKQAGGVSPPHPAGTPSHVQRTQRRRGSAARLRVCRGVVEGGPFHGIFHEMIRRIVESPRFPAAG